MNGEIQSEYDKIEELKSENENIEFTEKKKRGRPRKSEVEEKAKLPFVDISFIFDILVKRLPNPIPLSNTEKSLVNEATNKVLSKYDLNFKYIEEVNLAIILIGIFYPRMKKEEKKEEKKENIETVKNE